MIQAEKDKLQQQLAAVTKERDLLRKEFLEKYGDLLTLQQWVKQRDNLKQQVQAAKEALHTIARYGKDGICPYGCDTPAIAEAALKEAS